MFRDHSVEVEGDWAAGAAEVASPSHQEIDRQLRRLAKHRAGLDVEEARWLRRAEAQNSWRALGYVHALEYLEEVFGYAPRTAQEKLRVARELGDLPALEAELESGDADGELVFTRKGVVVRGEVDRGLALSPARQTTGGAPTDRGSIDTGGNGASGYRQVERNTLAKTALQQAGFKSSIAARGETCDDARARRCAARIAAQSGP